MGQAPDHLDKAAAFEPRQLRDRPLMVESLSAVPVDRLRHIHAAICFSARSLESGAPLRHMRVLFVPDLQLLYGAAQEMGTNATCLEDIFNIAQSGS